MKLNKHLFAKKGKLLVAVSGGVDSMVLLDLLLKDEQLRPFISVVHIHHGMREAATADREFVKQYCLTKKVPFFTNECIPFNLQSELEAREFRYNTIKEIVQNEDFSYLVTAHHLDDQIETILMKLVRGSSLSGMVGMKETRHFTATCQLVRPLLDVTKETIVTFAKKQQITFVEDETNRSPVYTRNRFRHQVLPLLYSETTALGKHFIDFSKDLNRVLTVNRRYIQKLEQQCFAGNQLVGEFFRALEADEQHLLLVHALEKRGILERSAVQQLCLFMQKVDGERKVDLKGDWQFRVAYGEGYFEKKQKQLVVLPTIHVTKKWSPKVLVEVSESDFPVSIRFRKPGDKILLNGFHKKVNRLFIDEKIDASKRDSIPLIVNKRDEIIAILDPRLLHLSKPKETGKIGMYYIVKDEEHD